MAIDPSIAMGYRGLGELPNPMNQLAQASQIQQSMRQGQMAESRYKKALDTEAKLSKYYASIAENGGPKTAKEAEQAMFGSGVEEIQNMAAQAQMLRLQNEQELEMFRGAQSPAGGAPAAAAPMEAPVNMMPGAVAAPAGVINNLGGRTVGEMLAERDRMALLPGKLAANRVKTLTADIALASREPSYQNVPGVGLVNPRDMSVVMPSVESTDPVIKQYNLAVSQGFKGSILDYKREIARAGRAPVAPRPEAAPTGKPLTALQERKAKETEVAQRSVVKSADTAATELETLADTLLGNPGKKIQPHPGLGGITGFMSVLPSMPESEARSAQQKLDTFKGKVMAFGRLLAVQQGKLGNMAVSEWKFISDAIEKIDPAANNFNDQLRDVVRQAKDFAAAKRETFDELYDSTTPTGAPAKPSAAAPAGAALTSADRQALDWAAANPNDPRAAQIRQKNGVK